MPDYSDKHVRGEKYKPLTSQEITHLVAHLDYWRRGGSTGGK
jgi:hypothetical protein